MDYIVHGILQARILEYSPHSLLQGIFPNHGSNPGLPYCRRILYQLSHHWKVLMLIEAPKLWLPNVKSWLIGEDPDAGKDWRQEEKGMTEDEMAEWHHWFNGHEFERTLGDGEGQGNLACCSRWGCRVGHNWVTEQEWMLQIILLSLKVSKAEIVGPGI